MFWFLEKFKGLFGIQKSEIEDITKELKPPFTLLQDKLAILPPYKNTIDVALKVKYFVLVFYGADWCGPCRMMLPAVKNYCLENSIEFVYIDTVIYHKQCMANGIKNIPYTELYIGGKLETTFVGAFAVNKIDSFIAPYLED